MLRRCYNPKVKDYSYYGGRGITVCPRWHDFANFLEDMGTRPPDKFIDRIDNNGNYEPDNCRWATSKENNRNTRAAILVTFNGRTQCMTAWASELGMPRKTLDERLRRGWTVRRAMTSPVTKGTL